VTTYDRPRLLAQAVDSVLNQTIRDLECIVVDDGSPNPATMPDDPRVRLIACERNGGLSAARNVGLDDARGTYVSFLDDDDLYTPTRVAIGLEAMRPGVDLTLCWLRPFSSTGEAGAPARFRRYRNRVLRGTVHDRILDRGRTSVGQALIRREVAARFDQRFRCAEDMEWWIRVARTAVVDTVPQFGYLRRRHAGPSQTRRLEQRIDCRFFLMEEHGDYFRAHPRAAARQWREIAEVAYSLGDHAYARAAFRLALRLNPLDRTARQLWYLARSLARSTSDVRVETLSIHTPVQAPTVAR
jgi:glycosyltransferase involved in cell wall biosynthesis